MDISEKALIYIIDHVFLPLKLPETGDQLDENEDFALLSLLLKTLQDFALFYDAQSDEAIKAVRGMINQLLLTIDQEGGVHEDSLLEKFQDMSSRGGILPICVKAQNAGLIVRKETDSIVFEAFELSPPNGEVMSTQGRLRRSFPGPAIAVPVSVFNEVGFRATVAQTISKMSHQSAADTKEKIMKAGQQHIEDRDTTNPELVTEFLMSILEAAGNPTSVPRIWKNTREEVLWSTGLLPWRRSPLWLLVRVSMQTTFSRLLPAGSHYKDLMVFFMAHILRLATEQRMPSDLLHCLISKISSRMIKLAPGGQRPWFPVLEDILSKAVEVIQVEWNAIMNMSDPDIDTAVLGTLDFAEDCAIELPELEEYIDLVQHPPSTSDAPTPHLPPELIVRFSPESLPSMELPFDGNTIYILAGFETWVASSIDSWLTAHMLDDSTCADLSNLLRQYHTMASKQYNGNPEGISIMLLTCLELWVASDKTATTQYPLLREYYPEIPSVLFGSLILPLKREMERLSLVENYLRNRQGAADQDFPPILSAFGVANSFSVRYYSTSQTHQDLRVQIERKARAERELKKTELRRKQAEYDRLILSQQNSTCEMRTVRDGSGRSRTEHSPHCTRCSDRKRAQSMRIEVHEWPLPADELEAQATVFEIDCPPPFNDWRDATMFTILDVFKGEYSKKLEPGFRFRPGFCLRTFVKVCVQKPSPRLGLLSEAKPHVASHRRDIRVSEATEDTVCVNNGMSYQYYDGKLNVFVRHIHVTDKVPHECTYQLQQSKSIQEFIFRPHSRPNGPDPNVVISRQCFCPADMSLEEFRALCTLPLGVRIQWSNVLVQLRMPSVDFKKIDTNLVLLQVAGQAGPASDDSVARDGHQDLLNEIFGRQLIQALQDGLERIKESWESCQALGGFIVMATKLLSLTMSDGVSETCLDYLAACREVALGWACRLRATARRTTQNDQRTDLLSRTFSLSQICASTFDVDTHYLENILGEASEGAKFVECAIMVRETTNAASIASNEWQLIYDQRWKHLAHRASELILDESLDLAIKKVWSEFRPSGEWSHHSQHPGHQHWMVTHTESTDDSCSQTVHYNLLTGELLVDGSPISRLPSAFENHKMYKLLFHRSTVEVMPTTMPGMQFSALKTFQGYSLFFGLRNDDFLLTCLKGDSRYDLLPSRIFRGKMPECFVEGCIHWYCHGTETVELRPFSTPWKPKQGAWTLSREWQDAWTMRKGGNTSLISMMSPTGENISRIFRSVELGTHIHTTFSDLDGQLLVELPRLKLGFSLHQQSARLQSRQFRGMYLDNSSCIGTLAGLRSKVVLKNDENERLFLIPNGKVQWCKTENHVNVDVRPGTSTRVYPFHIDPCLGRVLDEGTLESKLALCYYHALTSHCRPDELTRKTGTEQALEILNSAAVRSFDGLNPHCAKQLHMIAELVPRREYYPPNKQLMQKVRWCPNLSPLSQHGRLYMDAKAILSQASSLEFFYQSKLGKLKTLDHGDEFLIARDLIRSSTLRSSGFGAEHHTTSHDREYHSRNPPVPAGTRNHRRDSAYITASRIFQRLQTRQDRVHAGLGDRLWALLEHENTTMEDGGAHLRSHDVGYDAQKLDCRSYLCNYWCQIHRTLTQHRHSRFSIMMFLGILAFAKDAHLEAIEILSALHTVPTIEGETRIPTASYFDLRIGYAFDDGQLQEIVRSHARQFANCPEATLPRHHGESTSNRSRRRARVFEENLTAAVEKFVNSLKEQWPCQVPYRPVIATCETYIKTYAALEAVKPSFRAWFDNWSFYKYLSRIEGAVRRQAVVPLPPSAVEIALPPRSDPRQRAYLTDNDLFSTQAPLLLPVVPDITRVLVCSAPGDGAAVTERLHEMIGRLDTKASLRHEKAYVEDLRNSSAGLQAQGLKSRLAHDEANTLAVLVQNLGCCTDGLRRAHKSLADALSYVPNLLPGRVATTYNAPRVSTTFFLRQLARKRWTELSPSWQQAIVTYGLAMAAVQRANRLLCLRGNASDLIKELMNPGHEGWNPLDTPECLLIEVESNILIRQVQARIAAQMTDPPDNHNAVMQLNMGEGKSSVIVPVVATTLANGSRLVRVVVAKPQSKQMLQTLISKLGGLCDRQIYHMPFSRSLAVGPTEVGIISKTYRTCMETGGILLIQPEHILSFRLMGIESLLAGRHEVSRSLLGTQHLFNTCSRDIVDESDENFSVRFELVYTMGAQGPIDLSPERWLLIQALLRIMREVAPEISEDLHGSMEIEQGPPGSFPRTRLLHPIAHESLCRRLAEEICSSGLPGLPIARQPEAIRSAVFKYITVSELTDDEVSTVEGCAELWTESVIPVLLLLRGLISGGVLGFAFGHKRWRVNYGLDATRMPRTQLVVPFRAKDSPSPRSEFSHPDVVIILTCLSYYYGGLDDDDLFTAFERLAKSDQAAIEYGDWVRDAPSLPGPFRRLIGVNLKDRSQCINKVFPHLRQAQGVIDFFLSRVVFAREMKEFPSKLSASGWDIGQAKPQPTTGFSGTIDSKHLLPLSVKHLDLDEQRHTNALVLHHLLQPENSVQLMPAPPSTTLGSSDADRLLGLVINLPQQAQVILDVGAQVLELSNIQVAQAWLEKTTANAEKQAVVFFDDSDDLFVLDRGGHIECLQTSPFAKQLDLCYVFLDEAHTRGTDLKLPQDYRAVVTLGASLTKDRLVQACMRMRKLGKGQSVVFCIPEEIKAKILAATDKTDEFEINVSDVLIWSVHETCTDLRRSMPLWAAQGARFERHRRIWDEAQEPDDISLSEEAAKRFLEKEGLSISDRYKPGGTPPVTEIIAAHGQSPQLTAILERCSTFDCLQFTSATLQEEQERELSPEIEAERQVERPNPAEPYPHHLHPDILEFAQSGTLSPTSVAVMPAFHSLGSTSAALHLDVTQFPRDLLVTLDFARTVQVTEESFHTDDYHRPVQWILTSPVDQNSVGKVVIISPFEAEGLTPTLKESPGVRLHVYAPRLNLAYQPLDNLRLYVVPSVAEEWFLQPHLALQLNLFAGQVYFSSFDEYKRVCDFLGLAWRVEEDEVTVQTDGFIVSGQGGVLKRFESSPTKFLQVLFMRVRRNGQGIGRTQFGKVLAGELLRKSEFKYPSGNL